MARVLVNVPRQVAKGQAFEVKVLLSHPMESGQRRDAMGLAVPRDIVNHFVCMIDGELVLEADFFPAIAANPYLAFSATAERSGTLTLAFTDDHGVTLTEAVAITVT